MPSYKYTAVALDAYGLEEASHVCFTATEAIAIARDFLSEYAGVRIDKSSIFQSQIGSGIQPTPKPKTTKGKKK